MNRFVVMLIGLVALALAQNPVRLTDRDGTEVVVGAVGARYDSGLITLPASSTALTATTTKVQFIHCANIDSVARGLTITDNAASPQIYFNAVSIPANSVLTGNYGTTGLTFASGIKWNASATSGINCQIIGVQ